MDHATYLKEIVAAYQGEIRGEATFATLAEHSISADEIEIWQTLARLEATTRARLVPLMQRYGLDTTPDAEQQRVGRERGKARAAAGFATTIQSMTKTLVPFVELYARLEAEGPPQDRTELAFLSAHEVALHAFAISAVAGSDRDPLAPVRRLLTV